MSIIHQFRRGRRGEAGQTLVLYAVMALVLFLVVAMCVDGGMIYLTKAELDKAVDAAVLSKTEHVGRRGQKLHECSRRALRTAKERMAARGC